MKVVPPLGARKWPLSVCKAHTSAESCNISQISKLRRTGWFALESSTGGDGAQPARAPGPESACREERAIACADCLATITTTEQRLAVHGSHEHRFVNPAGLLFHIGCFAEAIGCRIVGPDSLEYPWFPGFAWRYASCARCGQHLGWHFRDDARSSKSTSLDVKSSFFGLILARLVQPGLDA